MTAPYVGRCACGQVNVTIDTEPVATRQCWCRQCQRLAAGGPTHNAIFAAGAVTLTGETRENSYVAASGNTLTHEFCPSCGTPVLARSSARPQFRTIRIGLLEPDTALRPTMAIWTADAPEWARIDPALEQHSGQPPPPSVPSN
jgi:hypothetical protein